MLSGTWLEVRLAAQRRPRQAPDVAEELILSREEAVGVAFAVHDILEVLERILRLLEGGDDGEEE